MYQLFIRRKKIDSDDEPARAIRRKKQASMVLAAKDVKDGEVDAMLSAEIQVRYWRLVSLSLAASKGWNALA